MKNKISIIILLILATTFIIAQSVFAQITLYENKTSEIVSKGVTRENIKRFTSDGWLNINVLHVDLTNPYIKLDTIFSKEGISARSTILKMANESKAISAINGDFFSPKPETNLAHPMGPMIKNGKIISTSADDENKFKLGVFSLDKRNKPYYIYWSKHINLIAPNSKGMQINDINKFGWYESLYMYDRNWGEKTVGSSNTFPTLTQMIVVNNRVKSITSGSGPINIPKNGYVICGDYKAGEFLKNNFRIGSRVKVDIKTSPNWKLMNSAVGGGAFLVKSGQIPKFTHELSGLQPRTAIGTTKDNKEAILVTVDGRQLSSNGMTQMQLAKLMQSLGAYNALNLDGGGSSTMVSRDLGSSNLKLINDSSDNSPRLVVNGIGIFSTAPHSKLYGIKIKAKETEVFKNSSIQFEAVGFDKNYNPVDIDKYRINWSASGISGTFKDNMFYPTSSGEAKITASINGIKDTIKINVLDYPVELIISPSYFEISTQAKEVEIYGKDKDGYKAKFNLSDINFTPNNEVVIQNNTIRLKNDTSQNIKASFGYVYTYLGNNNTSSVSKSTVLDNFESNNSKFWGYPSTVEGNYSISKSIKKFGNASGKLEFDFSKSNETKAAYVKLNGNGYKIYSRPKNISLWAYVPKDYPHSLKAEFVDASNNVFRTTFASEINWTGWEEVQTELPHNINYPITLRKIYIVQTKGDIKNSGKIYFDNLKILYTTNISQPPPSKTLKDYQEGSSYISSNSKNIAVYGNASKLPIIMRYRLLNAFNNKSDFTAFVSADTRTSSRLKHNYIAGNNNYKTKEYSNSLFVSLSAKNSNSIRKTNYNQWISLLKKLEQNNKSNIFILLDCSLDNFSDKLEEQLLKNILSDYVRKTNNNIWLIYLNDKYEVYNENGVKYIGIANGFSPLYLNINTDSGKPTYTFRKIY